jgi:hypothetical protein
MTLPTNPRFRLGKVVAIRKDEVDFPVKLRGRFFLLDQPFLARKAEEQYPNLFSLDYIGPGWYYSDGFTLWLHESRFRELTADEK